MTKWMWRLNECKANIQRTQIWISVNRVFCTNNIISVSYTHLLCGHTGGFVFLFPRIEKYEGNTWKVCNLSELTNYAIKHESLYFHHFTAFVYLLVIYFENLHSEFLHFRTPFYFTQIVYCVEQNIRCLLYTSRCV